MKKYVRATENEILSSLTKEASSKGVVLTYAHKLFFLRLLDYAEKAGEHTENGLSVTLSVQGLSEALKIPLRTTIQSLNRLTACGVLIRTEGEKTFPRSPAVTVICRKFYEKER